MEKVEGGKLLVIKVDFGDKIEKVDITGDFFAHPEESIKEIEKRLAGIKKDFDEKIQFYRKAGDGDFRNETACLGGIGKKKS